MNKNVKVVPTSDYEAVIAASSIFIDGLRNGDADLVMSAFHPDAVAFGYGSGKWMTGAASLLHGLIEQVGPAPEIRARLDVLAITPTTAVVRADIENDALGADYTDLYTLIKQNDAWKIVTNALHAYEN